MRSTMPLPEYAPDQTVNSGVLLVAQNTYAAADGYRPMRSLAPMSEAMGAVFNGGSSAIASDGAAYLLAGTSEGILRFQPGGTWSAIASGLTVTGRWEFTQFGNYVVSVNGSQTMEVDLAAGTATVIAGAPNGTSIAVIGDYVVVGQADNEISKVRWSAFRDHTAWTLGVDQAGEQPIQTGGAIAAVCGGEYGVILQRERITRMTRTGDSTAPFQFDEISHNFGCADGATIAQAGRTIFFRSDSGFMALDDGQSLRAIGSEKVDRTFDAVVSRDDIHNVFTAIDPTNKLVMWGVPGAPGVIWVYNYELDRWATAELAFSGLMPGYTTSTSLEALDITYPDLDAMTISLDDAQWAGGALRLYLFDSDNKVCTMTGETLGSRFDMGYSQLTPTRRARLRGIRPVCDATSGYTLIVTAKDRLGDVGTVKTATNYRSTGLMPVRNAGRFVSTSVRIAAGENWSYIQGLEFEFDAGGTR